MSLNGYCAFVTCLAMSNLLKGFALISFSGHLLHSTYILIQILYSNCSYIYVYRLQLWTFICCLFSYKSFIPPKDLLFFYLLKTALLPRSQEVDMALSPPGHPNHRVIRLLLRKIGSHFLFSHPGK